MPCRKLQGALAAVLRADVEWGVLPEGVSALLRFCIPCPGQYLQAAGGAVHPLAT